MAFSPVFHSPSNDAGNVREPAVFVPRRRFGPISEGVGDLEAARCPSEGQTRKSPWVALACPYFFFLAAVARAAQTAPAALSAVTFRVLVVTVRIIRSTYLVLRRERTGSLS